jgi:hypothetical protein
MRAFTLIFLFFVFVLVVVSPVRAFPPGEIERWRRLADEPGHSTALPLGVLYEAGKDVPQDYVAAAKWYRLCAETGWDACQLHLGMLYSRGQGVPQDFSLAHKWLNLAAAQGGTVAVELRDRMAASMPPSQIAEAQRLAREWRPGGEASFWRLNPEAWIKWLEQTRETVMASELWGYVRLAFYTLLCAMLSIYGLLYGGELIIATIAWRKTGKWDWKSPPH